MVTRKIFCVADTQKINRGSNHTATKVIKSQSKVAREEARNQRT